MGFNPNSERPPKREVGDVVLKWNLYAIFCGKSVISFPNGVIRPADTPKLSEDFKYFKGKAALRSNSCKQK